MSQQLEQQRALNALHEFIRRLRVPRARKAELEQPHVLPRAGIDVSREAVIDCFLGMNPDCDRFRELLETELVGRDSFSFDPERWGAVRGTCES